MSTISSHIALYQERNLTAGSIRDIWANETNFAVRRTLAILLLGTKGFTTKRIDDLKDEVRYEIFKRFGGLMNDDDTGIKESDFNLIYMVISSFFYGQTSASDTENEPTKPDTWSAAIGYYIFANFVAWIIEVFLFVGGINASHIMLIAPLAMIVSTLILVGLGAILESRKK